MFFSFFSFAFLLHIDPRPNSLAIVVPSISFLLGLASIWVLGGQEFSAFSSDEYPGVLLHSAHKYLNTRGVVVAFVEMFVSWSLCSV